MTELQCPTCLSFDRKHFPLDITKYGSLFDNIIMQNVDSVCWECINLFHKVYKFKQQVVLAQEHLTNTFEKLPTLAPLSHLICSTININDICCNLSLERISNLQVTNDLVQNIKSVWIDEDENYDSEYSYDVSLRVIQTDENDTLDRDINNSNIMNKNVSIKLFSDDTTLEKLPVKNEARKKTLTKRKAKHKIKKNESKKEKSKVSKHNYTIIKMTKKEMLAKREADRQTDRYKNKVKYRCELCICGFSDKNLYEKHMICKHSETAGPSQCPICEVRIRNLHYFKEHVVRHYQKYKCLLCPFIGYKVSKMVRHQAIEHDVTRFICDLCFEEFTSLASLRFHQEKTHEAVLKCQNCSQTFTSRKDLKVHLIEIHNKNIPKAECTVCGVSVLYLSTHMRSHRAAPKTAYCDECHVTFRSSWCYRAHLKYAVCVTPAKKC